MRWVILLLCLAGSGCGSPGYFLDFSPGYRAGVTLANALPAITLRPGETRMGMVNSSPLPRTRVNRLVSEDPAVVIVWKPPRPTDVIRIQAVAPGSVLVHRGNFPFEDWRAGRNLVERADWRASLRRHLSPRPDDEAFRKMSDRDLWTAVVRSRSKGALHVFVVKDRVEF